MKGGIAGLPPPTVFWTSTIPGQGTEVLSLSGLRRVAEVVIGGAADLLVDRLGRGLEERLQPDCGKKEAPKANDRAHLRDKAGGERRRTPKTTGSARLPESLDHTPVGELSGPLVGK